MYSAWNADSSQKVKKRIVLQTELTLIGPAHFGNGDADDSTDMPLLTSEVDGLSPLLLGTSLCGALRAYLTAVEYGYRTKGKSDESSAELLFGSHKSNKSNRSKQPSPLIVYDAIGKYCAHEHRCGVRINARTRTAENSALYSYQLWSTGTSFPITFQLLVLERHDEDRLRTALATALEGLSNGKITLGAKKTRGFGRVTTSDWKIREYDFTSSQGLLDWLSNGTANPPHKTLKNIVDFARARMMDRRSELSLQLNLALESSMLIRSDEGLTPSDPDTVHIRRRSMEKDSEAIIPGTSWNGALRSRSQRILSTIRPDLKERMVESLFGSPPERRERRFSSRVFVDESVIHNCNEDIVQNRVGIDPFTGGARDTALFKENPIFSSPDGSTELRLRVINPEKSDVGLLLLLLKDLWTGELPVGGEISIGRGRLKGKQAVLKLKQRDSEIVQEWTMSEKLGHIQVSGDDRAVLESYVSFLVNGVSG